jgi:hypothetical protein
LAQLNVIATRVDHLASRCERLRIGHGLRLVTLKNPTAISRKHTLVARTIREGGAMKTSKTTFIAAMLCIVGCIVGYKTGQGSMQDELDAKLAARDVQG